MKLIYKPKNKQEQILLALFGLFAIFGGFKLPIKIATIIKLVTNRENYYFFEGLIFFLILAFVFRILYELLFRKYTNLNSVLNFKNILLLVVGSILSIFVYNLIVLVIYYLIYRI